jgi:short subunit dehydrogenase-like uncharacterized protein
MKPVVAGRDVLAIPALAEPFGLEWRVFDLDDPNRLDQGLEGINVVLSCAGPFARTFAPLARACIRSKVHYLDVTGEVDVFEGLDALSDKAEKAGIMLMPGVGFDVVPTDSLSAHLHRRMPDAVRLDLGFSGLTALSHGTALTMVESLHEGGLIRHKGALKPVRVGQLIKTIDFGCGPQRAMAIRWGDVYTAHHTTGIASIRVYMPIPPGLGMMIRATGYMGWLLGSSPVQGMLKFMVDQRPGGPDVAKRASSQSYVWGEVRNAAGKRLVSRLVTPEGYSLTVEAALAIADRVMRGNVAPGFQTPGGHFGPDFVLELEGVSRTDE